MSQNVKCELGSVKQDVLGDAGWSLDSAAGWVPLKPSSEMEVSIQEFYYGMFLGLMPEESWWKKHDWTDGGGESQRVSTNP